MAIKYRTDNYPYKTYTALLTQTAPTTITSGSLITGETYTITTYVSGDDFSNVANVLSGTVNTTGCVFIATGTTPTNYTNGSTLDSAGNPRAIILENTLSGVPSWSRLGVGEYYITLVGEFANIDKIVQFVGSAGSSIPPQAVYNNVDSLGLNSFDAAGLFSDDKLDHTPIEIRIYN